MKQIRKRLTYANVMSSIAVFLMLGGGAAIAAKAVLPKKSVGTKQLKANAVSAAKLKRNAVTTNKLRNNAVSTPKLRNNAVSTSKIGNEAVTGAKVNESSLGQVPSAAKATVASSLEGQHSYVIKLNAGQQQTIATNGAVSTIAKCETGVEGTKDRLRILAATTANGAMMLGDTPHLGTGFGEFLETGTPEDQRVLTSITVEGGTVRAEFDIDRGWVMGPEGKMLGFNAEGQALALNYAGAKCVVGGVMNASG